MVYTPFDWETGEAGATPITAERLNALEQGVGDVSEQVEGRLSDASLNSTYGALSQATVLPADNIVGFAGDSITNASGATSNNGFVHHVRHIAGTRNVDQVIRVYATGGFTSAQVLATHIPSACAGDAAVIHVAVGTNDAGTVTVAAFAANIIEMHRQITEAGKKMTISLVPPRGSGATAAFRRSRAGYNEWISRWAPLAGVPVADTSALVDPATGHLRADCDSGDGTHPNDYGHAIIAEAVVEAVLEALPVQPRRQVKAPDVNLAQFGTIGAVASGLPTGWSELAGGTGTAPTYSVVSGANDLAEGNWLQMDFDATASGGTRTMRTGHGSLGTDFAALDQLEFSWLIELDDVVGLADAVEAGTATVRVVNLNTGGGVQAIALPAVRSLRLDRRGGYRFGQVSTSFPGFGVEVKLPTGVHARVRVGEVLVRNLTAIGATKSVA